MRHAGLFVALAAFGAMCGCATRSQSAAQWKFMLLSWKSASGQWHYSLRLNGKEEVSAKADTQHRFNSVHALERRLAELPPGTHVNWSKFRVMGFDYPPTEVIESIQSFAKAHQIYLYFNFVLEG